MATNLSVREICPTKLPRSKGCGIAGTVSVAPVSTEHAATAG